VRHGGNRIAKLYVDRGRGHVDEDSIFIPSNRRGTIREVVYLPNGLNNVLWQPMETTGRFTQSDLIFHRITAIESFWRRAWRVWEDVWRFRHLSPAERDGVRWYSPFTNLARAYAWTANLRRANSITVDYPSFIKRQDALSPDDVSAVLAHIAQLPLQLVLSIVMPVYNPPLDFFRAALDSVLAQHYPHWELCIADDASTDAQVRAIIDDYAHKDKRIKAVFRPENGHISAASNSALALATGEFVVLMDHDDALPAHALYHVAVEINRYPDVALIYSDEDKLDAFGMRVDPYFKSDWNPDLFYAQNMFSHLGVYRTALVRKLGGFRLGFEGSQDYDLALRCVQQVSAAQVRHIPRVLYHWRAHAASTAVAHGNKSYASTAGLHALQAHFEGTAIQVEETEAAGMYRTRYPLPVQLPLVTLIIPTRDQVDFLKQCITSIQTKTDYPNYEVLVMDNQSSDPAALVYLASLASDPRIRVIQYDAPFNYSAINNHAVTLARGEIIALVNNDIEVISPEWLSEMVSHALRPVIGAVGAKLLYGDGTIQHAGVILGYGGLAGHAHKYLEGESWGYFGRARLTQTLSAVTAACLLVRKAVFEQVGGLDAANLTVAFNDVDFCIKLREAGYRNLYTPYAELYHHESISRGQENSPAKQARFASEVAFMQKKWGDVLKADPYYNPNLTLDAENFAFANHVVKSSHHGYPLVV
jgi:glycosyltransferase involved in cell wall biosynthesis